MASFASCRSVIYGSLVLIKWTKTLNPSISEYLVPEHTYVLEKSLLIVLVKRNTPAKCFPIFVAAPKSKVMQHSSTVMPLFKSSRIASHGAPGIANASKTLSSYEEPLCSRL